MIISMCSNLYDAFGDFVLNVDFLDSDFSHISRRVSRTATLDGGSVIVDNGYSASDATFSIVISDIDDSKRLLLLLMIQRHSEIIVSAKNNIFLGVVETLEDKDKMKIKFLVKRQLNEA